MPISRGRMLIQMSMPKCSVMNPHFILSPELWAPWLQLPWYQLSMNHSVCSGFRIYSSLIMVPHPPVMISTNTPSMLVSNIDVSGLSDCVPTPKWNFSRAMETGAIYILAQLPCNSTWTAIRPGKARQAAWVSRFSHQRFSFTSEGSSIEKHSERLQWL